MVMNTFLSILCQGLLQAHMSTLASVCCPLQLFANAAGKETDSDVEQIMGGGGGGGGCTCLCKVRS